MLNIDSNSFINMLAGGVKLLEVNKDTVNNLNVFPVPDGDTGTNMSMTLASAVREAKNAASSSQSVSVIAAAYAKGALRGARGNSGVITSQIMKGFEIAAEDKDAFNAYDFAAALKKGTEIAYGAVTRPQEGTILTVIRVMAEHAQELTKKKKQDIEIEPFLLSVIDAGEAALLKTPEMLPVLKKAGVVDAGGKGLMYVMRGFYNALTGADIAEEQPDNANAASKSVNTPVDMFEGNPDDHEHINFSYCTEYFIIHLLPKVTVADIDKLRDFLTALGDCVLVIGDLELVKVHVHTNRPDQALKAALKLGELDSVKIENMVEQNRNLIEKNKESAPLKEYGMISVCAGEGMSDVFTDLGVDVVVEGGQTMNPSVYDILTAINKVKAKNIFIFPNNKNIILAAEQAKGLTDANVVVIPSVNIAQGISAIVSFMAENTLEDNVTAMKEAMKKVRCGQVTQAVRSTRMNGFSLKEGDIIGLDDKKIVAKGCSVDDVVCDTIDSMIDDESCMLNLYYGDNVTGEEAEALSARLTEKYPDFEVMVISGGQPHYYYIISVE